MIALTLVFSVLLSGIVYRCEMEDGAIEFRGLPCPDGVGVEWAVPSAPAARSTPSNRPANGLSDAEVRELAALQQRLAGDAADAKRRRGAQQRRRVSRAAERRKRCEVAVSRIGSLRVQKRRGYAAKDAPRLDAEQTRLESIIDADC
jgi:hypothetical protein